LFYIGLDDTDNQVSRGTGRLARAIAEALAGRFELLGVTRHQLLVDPRVPYTSHNSSATLHLRGNSDVDLCTIADEVQEMMLADFQAGSDPGLCVAQAVTADMSAFGRRAKVDLVTQDEARAIARAAGCILRGLGGTRDGVIGALAGVGLAATGQDGRFLLVGTARDLAGVQCVEAILASGISEVRYPDGTRMEAGLVDTNGKLRPALRDGRPVLYVKHPDGDSGRWVPARLE